MRFTKEEVERSLDPKMVSLLHFNIFVFVVDHFHKISLKIPTFGFQVDDGNVDVGDGGAIGWHHRLAPVGLLYMGAVYVNGRCTRP